MTPIILIGNHLGERHRYLNSAVNEAYRRKQDFSSLEDLAEQSPVDRIFKINLALRLRNVDYIIKNLKEDDMFYVSKALKCKWLLEPEFQYILNPEYLEDTLYPSMITTAVTKMKHWVFSNLKDPERCQRFFLYYCDINFKLAVKFLRNCSADIIKEQYSKHMHEISPHDFKIFCEKDPLVAKMFFDALLIDEELKELYLSKEKQYFTTLKSLLKSNTTMVLDVTERYFNKRIIKPFSTKATKYILKHYRTRFTQKPELYTAWLLHLQTLANCLNSKDAMDLTLTLARDNYLITQKWFDYKTVEPILKRMKPEDRGAIKKKVFVDHDVGTIIEKWAYEIPSSPARIKKVSPIFEDREHDPSQFKNSGEKFLKGRRLCCASSATAACFRSSVKTMLDKLFDEYRVASFDKVLFELRKKLKAESSAQTRQYMMLVLVSKSGGRENNLASVMQLLSNYKNEPSQLRAAVVRSLVTRAQVWRVIDDTWKKFLEFSRGLGLDGERPEANCIEGIHAVFIRQLLDGTCDPKILSLYLNNFSTLEQYSLSNSEKKNISDLLPTFLFNKACEETNVFVVLSLINQLLDILTAFKLSIKQYPGLISKIESLAKTDISRTTGILMRLYRSKIARRELFKVNFAIVETKESYLNALRHDTDVISTQNLVRLILGNKQKLSTSSSRIPYRWSTKPKPNLYHELFSKISIYFNEKDGLAKQFLNVLKSEGRKKVLARPLSLLLGDELMPYVKNIDSSIVEIKDKIFAAAMRANAHLARPALNFDIFGWSAIGTKAIANKVVVCRKREVNDYVQKLVENKQTIKLAWLLAKRNGNYLHCFAILSRTKPTAALKSGLKIIMHQKDSVDTNIWNIITSLIENLNSNKIKHFEFPNASSMPVQIRPAYSIALYKKYRKESFFKSMPFLCQIENLLTNVNDEFIENVIVEFLSNDINLISEEYSNQKYHEFRINRMYIRIIIKYLLLSKTKESQQKKYESIGVVFFDKLEIWCRSEEYKKYFQIYLEEMITTFRYYKVFLSSEYVSCMPVMKRVITWMKKNLSIELNFKEYAHMHLNMIYYRSIKKTIDMLPRNTIDEDNQMEARNMVGYILGKYIAQEINILKTTYFDSVQCLYNDIFCKLEDFIHYCDIYTASLINGILDQSENNVLAIYLFKKRRSTLGTKSRQEILLRLRKCENIEMQMVFSGETFLNI